MWEFDLNEFQYKKNICHDHLYTYFNFTLTFYLYKITYVMKFNMIFSIG